MALISVPGDGLRASLDKDDMVSIYVCGEDKTRQIKDWEIAKSPRQGELTLICHFPSGKHFTRPLGDCEVVPTREVSRMLLARNGGSLVSLIDKAVIYGEKYAVVQYPDNPERYLFRMEAIEFVAPTTMKDESIFRYFLAVAQARADRAASDEDRQIAANVVRQLEALPPCPGTALHAYCSGRNERREQGADFIFPFGINQSQLKAVEQAFASQVSLIEGPPGTGKTQTILNIIANILLRGSTVAVLSNNNAAVDNVYEKLGKSGLDYLVARLGNKKNREEFFANPVQWPATDSGPAPTMEHIQTTLQRLKGHLHAQNAVAQLQMELDELRIERRYLVQWRQENGVRAPEALDRYRLSAQKTADLMAYLAYLDAGRIRIRDRIELLFNFRILRTQPFADWEKRKSAFYGLQLRYYDQAIKEKEAALAVHRDALERGNFKALLEELTTCSMRCLKHHLQQQAPQAEAFDAKSYRQKFDAFVKRYPIIGSGTHSIVNSLKQGAILDYVIIDEASQQDIVPGILALGCAKNLIIVGDRKQLAHIPTQLGMAAPAEHYDCDRYSLLDSCVGVFAGAIPMTLLQEHYRCHPKIIQFCNQQFYDNQLVPMTRDGGEQALTLIVTAKGNHTRANANLREVESLLAVLDEEGEEVWLGEDGRGFIAPFRAQATLAKGHLPSDFVRNTVHKFQGRECGEIVFSTVLDKKRASQRLLAFVDDPRMVNVAVSRAKHRFTLVTGDDVFTANNGHIAALVRYMAYYADAGQIHRAPLVSAFDLLYREYDQSLERLDARLRLEDSRYKSERIVAQILRATLARKAYQALNFHAQIDLIQLASTANEDLTAREREFMNNRASCDFVLYFKVGKTPLGVIEVDGGSHDKPQQAERDALKNSILAKSAIPLLRLRTVESRIEERIEAFLAPWASQASGV